MWVVSAEVRLAYKSTSRDNCRSGKGLDLKQPGSTASDSLATGPRPPRRGLCMLLVIDPTEHRVDDGKCTRQADSSTAGCDELAVMRGKDAHHRRDKPREGIDQPGKEDVGVQPYGVTLPATPKPKGRERVE